MADKVDFGVWRADGDPYVYISDGKGEVVTLDTRAPEEGVKKLDKAQVKAVMDQIKEGTLQNAPERKGSPEGGEEPPAAEKPEDKPAEGQEDDKPSDDTKMQGGDSPSREQLQREAEDRKDLREGEGPKAGERFPGLEGARGRVMAVLHKGTPERKELADEMYKKHFGGSSDE